MRWWPGPPGDVSCPTEVLPDEPVAPYEGADDELLGALAALPRMQRTVVVMRYWLDLPVARCAVELGISEGTVKAHASRGVAALRAAMGADVRR